MNERRNSDKKRESANEKEEGEEGRRAIKEWQTVSYKYTEVGD